MRRTGLRALVGWSVLTALVISGCSIQGEGRSADQEIPAPEVTVEPPHPPASAAATETKDASEPPVPVAPVMDCTAPTVELTEVRYGSPFLMDHPDAVIPRGWDYTITNSGSNEVEVWGVDVTINFKPKPESIRISSPGFSDEVLLEGWQVGTTLHPPVLGPGETVKEYDTYHGGSTISTSNGEPTVTLGTVYYNFIDEAVSAACPHQ